MAFPKFSVIIPVYNSEKTLRHCLSSIVNQSFKDFEVILVNDGSVDESLNICNEFRTCYHFIRVISKENGGASSARNVALEAAIGEWIVFADSDDYVCPEWLANFYSGIERNPDLVVQGFECSGSLYGDVSCDSEKSYYSVDCQGDVRDCLIQLHDHGTVGYLWCKAFRKSIISQNRIRFNETFNYHEDEDFILRYLINCSQIIQIPSIGYYYNVPKWSKYVVRNRYELFKEKWNSIQTIFGKEYNTVVSTYLNNLIFNLFTVLREENLFRNKRHLILDCRKTLDKYVLRASIFPLTKVMIWADFSGYLSSILVEIHLKLNGARFKD